MDYKIAKPKLFTEPLCDLDKFFDKLPLEIRNCIYFWIIRPDCLRNCGKIHAHHHKSDRCLDFLTAAPRFYVEAIEILHSVEHRLEITKSGMPLFRSGKDFGKPLQFECEKPTSRCYLPPNLSELEFVRLRKIKLMIHFEPFGTTQLDRNLKTLSQAVRKMTNVEYIQICLRYCDSYRDRFTEFNALDHLVRTIVGKKIYMIFGPHSHDAPGRHLHDWIKTVAKRFTTNIEFIPWPLERSDSPSPSLSWMGPNDHWNWKIRDDDVTWQINDNDENNEMNEHDMNYAASETQEASEITSKSQPQEACEALNDPLAQPCQSQISSETCAMYEAPNGILQSDYITCSALKVKYQLIPECRSCLAVFGTWQALKAHLVRSPSHQRSFAKRPQNFVRERDRKPANRKCWTCGAGFANLHMLDDHLYTHRHRRHGIVPRYVEDNERYDNKWRLWKEERGWL